MEGFGGGSSLITDHTMLKIINSIMDPNDGAGLMNWTNFQNLFSGGALSRKCSYFSLYNSFVKYNYTIYYTYKLP